MKPLSTTLRPLLHAPGFTATAVAAIALATGASTAVFSLAYSVVLRPLPFPDPSHLYSVSQFYPSFNQNIVPSPVYLDWRDRVATSAEQTARIAAYSMGDYTYSGGAADGPAERLPAAMVSADFFRVLGVSPVRGRTFTAAEDFPGSDAVALVREGFPTPPGSAIALDGRRYIVIGTLPAAFAFPPGVRVWVPLALDPVRERSGGPMQLVRVIARWRRAPALTAAEGARLVVTPLQTWLTGRTRTLWFVLLGAVTLVLLIACTNVAGLLIARGAARRREMAIRLALGAPAARLARELLAESLALSVAGSAVGFVLGSVLVHGLLPLLPDALLAGRPVVLDAPVFLFAAAIALATALASGIAPAREAARVDVAESLKQAPTTATARHLGMRSLLIAGEIALSLALLSSAALMVRSFATLAAVDPGFQPQGVLAASLNLPDTRHQPYLAAALEQAAALPGVRAAGLLSALPFSPGGVSRALISAEGEPPWGAADAERHRVETILVGGEAFRALGLPLRRGRGLLPRDTDAAVVNETLARRFFGTPQAVGRRIKTGLAESPSPWITIVGIVGDAKLSALDEYVPATLFRPYQQAQNLRAMGLVLRSDGDPAGLALPLRRALARLDATVAVSGIEPIEQRLSASMASPRLRSVAASLMAGMALIIAMAGLYGVLSYIVAQRAAELGIRIALGAGPAAIFRLVLGRGLALAGGGIGAGLLLSLAAGRFLRGLLFELAPWDPLTLGSAAVAMLAVAAAASFAPALRATRTDPIRCLRQE
ncbi:MAG TPA: ADOP family duplicated permease [Bryobacteraceae bacterium]|nr:ADOP family duplicated permease [Bryobacteraceae bacterium]